MFENTISGSEYLKSEQKLADGPSHEDSEPKTVLPDPPPQDKSVEIQEIVLYSVGESCVARWEEDQV